MFTERDHLTFKRYKLQNSSNGGTTIRAQKMGVRYSSIGRSLNKGDDANNIRFMIKLTLCVPTCCRLFYFAKKKRERKDSAARDEKG